MVAEDRQRPPADGRGKNELPFLAEGIDIFVSSLVGPGVVRIAEVPPFDLPWIGNRMRGRDEAGDI